MPIYTIYLASHSINFLALESMAKLAASQFDGWEYKIEKIPNVRSAERATEIVNTASKNNPSIIVFSSTLTEVREAFNTCTSKFNIECVDILFPTTQTIGRVLKSTPKYQSEYLWQLDDEYYKKIDAIEFAINNDDGRGLNSLKKADLVLIGVSRTSKTPLSIYLAHHNYLVVNVPLISGQNPSEYLFEIPSKKVIGLTISPHRLNEIRRARNTTMGIAGESSYSDMNHIINELEFADNIMKRIGCPVIDVSNKAVEETAEIIMKLTTN